MQISKDSIYEGRISGITKFGVFVEISKDVSGLVHISEVSKTYVQDINDIYKIGDNVKVKVLDCSDMKKISLSIKRANDVNSSKSFSEPKSFECVKTTNETQSLDDMIAKFKKSSEEKFSQLKHKNSETRRPRRSSK